MNSIIKTPEERLKKDEIAFFNDNLDTVLKLIPNGDIMLRGKKISNDKELINIIRKSIFKN